jgi:hypothetical protein
MRLSFLSRAGEPTATAAAAGGQAQAWKFLAFRPDMLRQSANKEFDVKAGLGN